MESSLDLRSILAGTAVQNQGYSGISKVRDYMNNLQTQEEKWAQFCLNPTQISPARMPVMFPIETHIYKETATTSINISTSTGLGYRSLWQPEYARGIGRYTYLNAYAGNIDNTNPANPTSTKIVLGDDSSRSQVALGGVRLIGAELVIDYLGSVEDSQGLIECGLKLNSHKNLLTDGSTFILNDDDQHFATDDEMARAPYYTKHRLSDGIRTIWFPIDKSKFEWRPHWHADAVNPTTVAQQQQSPFNQDPVRLEWFINIIAPPSTASGVIRVRIHQYYESVPDEQFNNLFCPERPMSGDSENAIRAVHESIKHTGGASHSLSGMGTFMSAVADKVGQYFMPALGGLAQGYGMVTGNPLIYGVGAGISSVDTGMGNRPLAIKNYRS